MPSVLETEVTGGLASAEQIDPDIDLQIYIDSNKTNKELLPHFSFDAVWFSSFAIFVCYLLIVDSSTKLDRPGPLLQQVAPFLKFGLTWGNFILLISSWLSSNTMLDCSALQILIKRNPNLQSLVSHCQIWWTNSKRKILLHKSLKCYPFYAKVSLILLTFLIV